MQASSLFLGQGVHAVEVAVAESLTEPNQAALVGAWKARKGGRAAPLLLVVLRPGGVSICGPAGDPPAVYKAEDPSPVEAICRLALDQPDRHAALRALAQALPSLETDLPGIRNEGLVALHELQRGVPKRPDWSGAGRRAAAAKGRSGTALLKALGYRIERLDNLTSILRSGSRSTALAIMLRKDETAEGRSNRFETLSPISYALKKADDESLDWVLLVQGSRLRLYPTDIDVGVGRRGRTETYIECEASLLGNGQLPFLWLLYSAEALSKGGSLNEILKESRRFAGDLADTLRERIYGEVVPELARGIAAARQLESPDASDLDRTYRMALTVLFRLLFVAYAEDQDLLPYRANQAYRKRSLKQKAQELAKLVGSGAAIAGGDSHWHEVVLVWTALAKGNSEWGVPAYDGGMFSDDPEVSPAGAELTGMSLPNSTFETALRGLLVIETPEGTPGPVDFRALGVREFGTIYEGLLESELAVATEDLALNAKGAYVPVRRGVKAAVTRGEIYIHNRSGVRKSTGSYYTQAFAVEHLLDGALEPALKEHLRRLRGLDDADATEEFFNFRVADIAMGSGHFLIAAIDRIERRLTDFLADRHLSGVRNELSALRSAAEEQLGELAETVTIEDTQLIRRLIARRCIYGADLNAISVQLARLSVWIHTFVPGLPLSYLDRSLVHGNSLVGVGTVEEIRQRVGEQTLPLFKLNAQELLGTATRPLQRLANLNDATLQDIEEARALSAEAEEAVEPAKALCDLVAAQPVSDDPAVKDCRFGELEELPSDLAGTEAARSARNTMADLRAIHFPIAFPEVFLRQRSGFDVILGNPPWQEATIEERAFWARHSPGLRSLPQRKQEREKARLRAARPDLWKRYRVEVYANARIRRALLGGAYPGMGKGDPDLYKAFCWRFWCLTVAEGGRIGVVLPRSALSAKGSAPFRETVFRRAGSVDVTMLINNRNWVFPEVHPQYSIGLVSVARGTASGQSIRLSGPFASAAAFAGRSGLARAFSRSEVLAWNDTASLPLLPDEHPVGVFAQLRKAPRLDLNIEGRWRARPDREMDATNQKPLMDLTSRERPDGYWPVYKGASFDLWNPDTGSYYAWIDPGPALKWLQKKRLWAKQRVPRSAHREFQSSYVEDRATLAPRRARVAFRDVARATDSRTVRVALMPPSVFIANQAPYLLWRRGDEQDEAYLLGVLSSIPLDWYARRFVETHLNFFILNPFPVPRPGRSDPLWQRTVALAGRLACPDDRFSTWAQAVGVDCGPLPSDEKKSMICELDAVVARLYGLDEAQLVHVFETFHVGWDYQDRLDGVLGYFRRLASDRSERAIE